ncbi:hypothetical protein V5799_006639 [Amblyomma americanum]|uniref:Secreted protein n=1 Tax=Amblyomma americanum TaxID=6943 RepID=A0AAQ4DVU1_AMBAM
MTPAKLLSFTLLAATLMLMLGRCSAYGDDYIQACPTTSSCLVLQDGRQYGCPNGCGCISDMYNDGFYAGYGKCYRLPSQSG